MWRVPLLPLRLTGDFSIVDADIGVVLYTSQYRETDYSVGTDHDGGINPFLPDIDLLSKRQHWR